MKLKKIVQSMFSLVYVSSATHLLSNQDPVRLLQQSREKNVRLGVSGMLLYKDGNFIQVLEGPEKNVRDLYLTISKDHRHKGLIVLLEEKIAERRFPDWSMGFRNLRDVNLEEVPGYTDQPGVQLHSGSPAARSCAGADDALPRGRQRDQPGVCGCRQQGDGGVGRCNSDLPQRRSDGDTRNQFPRWNL